MFLPPALLMSASVLMCGPLSNEVRADTTYLTKDEALEIVCGKECTIEYEKRQLPEDLLKTLERLDAEPQGEPISHLFRCMTGGTVAHYAFIDQQIGKHAPITFIVGISPKGEVSRVEILVYRENYGSQARERSYLEQFEGKVQSDQLVVGREIRNVTGATLSSRAISVGVRRNLAIWNYFFGK